jgi:cell wall-associated NlpC family hydrolase
MRCAAPLAAIVVALLAGGSASAAKPRPPWAQAEIAAVVASGLMGGDAASFRAGEPLTQGELAELVAGLGGKPAAVVRPDAPASLASLDAQLVRALGLADAAASVTRAARSAGFAPPARFGTEAVARLLGLRKNHPAAQDSLELLPGDAATRAEAAYSAARILRLRPGEVESVRAAVTSFAPPPLDAWQRRVLSRAAAFVGFPYVWGGESEQVQGPTAPFGAQVQGGFDCSGYVWRVYKLHPFPEAVELAATLRGRTTFALAAEVKRSARIPFAQLLPGDVLFFGARGPASQPSQVDHMAVYAGSGWMLHSSVHGVTLAPLTGWFRTRFAWARRPLAEAGLTASPTLAP